MSSTVLPGQLCFGIGCTCVASRRGAPGVSSSAGLTPVAAILSNMGYLIPKEVCDEKAQEVVAENCEANLQKFSKSDA